MPWRRVDRALVLLAASTLAATFLVAWLTPYRELDHRGCGMDASFYLSHFSLWFLVVRWCWRALKALNGAMERRLGGRERARPAAKLDPVAPSKSYQA